MLIRIQQLNLIHWVQGLRHALYNPPAQPELHQPEGMTLRHTSGGCAQAAHARCLIVRPQGSPYAGHSGSNSHGSCRALQEDTHTYLKFASLCRKQNRSR